MKTKDNILKVRIDNDMKSWFNILENKYHVKKCEFVRKAIIEKFQRDTPKLRLEQKKSKLPF